MFKTNYLTFALFCVIFSISCAEKQKNFVRSLDSTPEIFERTLIDITDLSTHSLSDTTEVILPAHIRPFQDKVYVSDFSDFTIYQYNQEGMRTGKLETGRGRGPGEFQNLSDFDLINDALWAVDSQNMMINALDVNTGEIITNFSVDRRPIRITTLQDGFIVQWLGSDLLFSKYDYQGNELKKFGKIVENQTQHALSLGGSVRSNRKDRFVYIPYYSSLIYQYQNNGELLNILKAPDGIEFPVTRKEGSVSVAPDHSFMRDGWIGDNNKLYVYVVLPGKRNNNGDWEGDPLSFLDRYDLTSGQYEASLQLPFVHSDAIFNPRTSVIYTEEGLEGKSFIHQLIVEDDF